MRKLEVHLRHVCLDLLRLVHRVCSMPSSRRTWNWYRGRGQARRPWLGFWKNWEWSLSIQRQMLCFFRFIWMKSLSETNYTINPNKNFHRVLQVPLSSFHLFAEATFGHWPLIQSGSSRRWVVGVGVELLGVWSTTAVLKGFSCCTIGVIWASTWNFDTSWMFLTWCFWWVVLYWATQFQVSSQARKSIKNWSHIQITIDYKRSHVFLIAVVWKSSNIKHMSRLFKLLQVELKTQANRLVKIEMKSQPLSPSTTMADT